MSKEQSPEPKNHEALNIGGVGGSYFRPKTRGELASKISEGVPCEVVTINRQFTCICLDGWLKMEGKYRVRLSENEGWDVYEAV